MSIESILGTRSAEELQVLRAFQNRPTDPMDIVEIAVRAGLTPSQARNSANSLFADDFLEMTPGPAGRTLYRLPTVFPKVSWKKNALALALSVVIAIALLLSPMPWWVSLFPVLVASALVSSEIWTLKSYRESSWTDSVN